MTEDATVRAHALAVNEEEQVSICGLISSRETSQCLACKPVHFKRRLEQALAAV